MENITIITVAIASFLSIMLLIFIIERLYLLSHNKKFIGRKWEYEERFILEPKENITAYEVAVILNKLSPGRFDGEFLSTLPDVTRLTRHFKKMSLKEFDAVYNPDMEIDEDEQKNSKEDQQVIKP